MYRIAFGLALSQWPDESHEEIAKIAFDPALATFRHWSGEIENPALKRELAISRLVGMYDEISERRYEHDGNGPKVMLNKLEGVVQDLSECARG